MPTKDLFTGKSAELLVFSELIKRGAEVYTPILDVGVDAIVRGKDGKLREIQIKATKEDEQAGYFNVYDLDKHPEDGFFVVCIDMNEKKCKVNGKPNIWVLSAKDFKEYMVAGCRLPIYEKSLKHGGKSREELLLDRFEAWEQLVGG